MGGGGKWTFAIMTGCFGIKRIETFTNRAACGIRFGGGRGGGSLGCREERRSLPSDPNKPAWIRESSAVGGKVIQPKKGMVCLLMPAREWTECRKQTKFEDYSGGDRRGQERGGRSQNQSPAEARKLQ